jgi:hypothetical protein
VGSILLWFLLLLWGLPAYSQGVSQPLPTTHPPTYLTGISETDILPRSAQLIPLPPLYAAGTGGIFNVGLGIVPQSLGGTGAPDGQHAFQKMIDGPAGSMIVRGTDFWGILGSGVPGSVLSTSKDGTPIWTMSAVSIPKDAPILTTSTTSYPNASVIASQPNSGVTLSTVGNQTQIGTDNTILRTTGGQTIFGPLTFTGTPILAKALAFKGSFQTTSIWAQDPRLDRSYRIPDTGVDSDFVMSDGAQTIHGLKLFADLGLSVHSVTVGADTLSFPPSSDTLVNCSGPQTLTKKTLIGAEFANAPPYLVLDGDTRGAYTVDWQAPAGSRHYSIYDANTDAFFSLFAGNQSPGGVVYSDGAVQRVSDSGPAGQPLLSGGRLPPHFGPLSVLGGGTGVTAFTPNSILTTDASGNLQFVPSYKSGMGQADLASFNPGDMLYALSDGTFAKVPIGAPGQVLTVSENRIPVWK